jgi:hypothetical protein
MENEQPAPKTSLAMTAKSAVIKAAHAARVPVTVGIAYAANRGASSLLTAGLMAIPAVIVIPEVAVMGTALAIGLACAIGADRLQRRYL